MREITYIEALREALREEMRRDKTVIIMGEDIQRGYADGIFGVTKGLVDEFGEERVRNTPISEAGFTGAAVGAALTGLRPIVEIMYVDWITIALEQIANVATKIRYVSGGAYKKVPIVIRSPQGAGTRSAACHSQSLEAWFIHIPGLKVVLPSTPYDAKGLLKTAIRDDDPVIFLEHKLLYKLKGPVPEEEYLIPFGKADVKREGSDVTILTYSYMVHKSLNAAKELSKEGIDVEVVDLRTLIPLDKKTMIESVKKTGRVITVEEGTKTGGVGAELAAIIIEEAFDYLDAPIKRVAAKEVPIPYSPVLEDYVVPNENDIINAVKSIV